MDCVGGEDLLRLLKRSSLSVLSVCSLQSSSCLRSWFLPFCTRRVGFGHVVIVPISCFLAVERCFWNFSRRCIARYLATSRARPHWPRLRRLASFNFRPKHAELACLGSEGCRFALSASTRGPSTTTQTPSWFEAARAGASSAPTRGYGRSAKPPALETARCATSDAADRCTRRKGLRMDLSSARRVAVSCLGRASRRGSWLVSADATAARRARAPLI